MAFSTEQKKQLSIMVDSPEKFLEKIENGEVYLPVFRNQFFKDGAGIFHILSECIVNKELNGNYINIMNILLRKENRLNLFQQTGRKDSAFSILMNYAKENGSLNNYISDWIIQSQDEEKKDSTNKYQISSFIKVLAEQNDISNINKILSAFPDFNNDKSLIQRLLEISIEKNNKNMLDFLLSNKEMRQILDNKIGSFKFNSNKKYFDPTYVNAYSFGVKNGAKDITLKLLDIFSTKININGQIIQDELYSHTKIFSNVKHPLNEILEKNVNLKEDDRDFFIQFYTRLSLEEKTKWIVLGNNRINALYEKKLENLVLNDLEDIFKSDKIDDTLKLSIFNMLMHYDNFSTELVEDRNKYQTIEKIVDPLWKYLPKIQGRSKFVSSHFLFNAFNSNGNMREEERESFSNIVQKLIEYNHIDYMPSMFGKSFFNEPKLVKKLINKGLSLEKLISYQYLGEPKIQEFNIFELYLNVEREEKKNYDKNRRYLLQLDRAKETLSLIHEYNPKLIFNFCSKTKEKEDICLLELAIQNNNTEIFELLSIEDLKKFKNAGFEEDIVSKLSGHINYSAESKNRFSYIVQRLFDSDYNLIINTEKNIPVYFYFFDKVSNLELLDRILDKFKIDLNKVAEGTDFWLKIDTENSLPLLKNRLNKTMDEVKARNILQVLSSSDSFKNNLKLFLSSYPDLSNIKLSEGDNILHKAIKNEAYDNAAYIVENFPDLGVESNNQHKMPVSYFIAKFAKDVNKSENGGNNFKLQIESLKQLFRKIICIGLISKDKKANKFLDEQLEKYSIIEEAFPEIIKEYNYYKLNKMLPSENKKEIKKLKL